MEATSSQSPNARYFGESSPTELRDLERNAKRATTKQMARAATYLQCAFHGQHYAWFGGWALKLRGSRRDTRDIDLLVRADGIRQTIMSFYEITGSIQERMFVDVGENGQVVGADIVLSNGNLNTPILGEPDSIEMIQPQVRIMHGDRVPVIDLAWQVEGKLWTWTSRTKDSDFQDLVFLFHTYGDRVKEWSEHLKKDQRINFYEVYKVEAKDKAAQKKMKEVLSL
ncbi:hypothetical protein QBC33DRAFT_520069 [Phialemonium atrogriseum]|uniref:Uncharacterized protein n=1 Tax=Phialemonium atrogriseum TaxID=1093897 RepID=A0AAJ0FC70_9PEZI|nr:uncharacterized protein QBC33DRAFT_520069 [Phialemonium atrogriseum]KAK1761832.1 hypothetical protein QBC33DRAFT_520069 [Phialemonium atrogriseum]